ncbi:protein-L-isoaspartate(D-aspartate) O-methyltransferase [Candidatus Woesearchaeota archaeon]|nr:protein-L-isoaspartate(D-aspartate) O-methyltransferase [Candidatus Woesearchaeota archaeon]
MDFEAAREKLIDELKLEGIKDVKVLEAFSKIHRDLFVPDEMLSESYANIPLPIGYGQTISQPYTIAIMLEALGLKPGDKVLEAGTGSGYNAALIGHIVGSKGKVFTTEIVPELVNRSKDKIRGVGLKNIKVVNCDGSLGYAKEAPYDKIIVTAACREIPPLLLEQLRDNGVLVAPVGSRHEQRMLKVRKTGNKLDIKSLGFFVFVPLKGAYEP